MNAILLSAGFGTRFRPYTQKLAKPAIPFLNLPFIGYSLYYAQKFSCKNITINTHHLPDTIEKSVKSIQQHLNLNIQFINESPDILDGGGGIKNAQKHLDSTDHFLVINTDAPHVFPNIDFVEILNQHKNNNALCTFLTVPIIKPNNEQKGIWTKESSSLIEHIGLNNNNQLNFNQFIGVIILSKKIFNYFDEKNKFNLIYDTLLPLLKNKKEKAYVHTIKNYQWIETGNLNGYLQASNYYLDELTVNSQSVVSKELLNILSFYDLKPYLYKSDSCKVLTLNETHLDEDYKLKGHIVLDKHTQLNGQFNITNSVLVNQTQLKSDISDTFLIT